MGNLRDRGKPRVMGHPTNTQIFKAIKEGIAEVLEKMEKYQEELNKKFEQMEKKYDRD